MKNLYNILVLITILFSSNFVKSQDDILNKINDESLDKIKQSLVSK